MRPLATSHSSVRGALEVERVALARPELPAWGDVPVNFSSFRFAASGRLVDGLALTLAEALADRWAAREPSRTVLAVCPRAQARSRQGAPARPAAIGADA